MIASRTLACVLPGGQKATASTAFQRPITCTSHYAGVFRLPIENFPHIRESYLSDTISWSVLIYAQGTDERQKIRTFLGSSHVHKFREVKCYVSHAKVAFRIKLEKKPCSTSLTLFYFVQFHHVEVICLTQETFRLMRFKIIFYLIWVFKMFSKYRIFFNRRVARSH